LVQKRQKGNTGHSGCADEGDVAPEVTQQRPRYAVGAALDLRAAAPRPELRRITSGEVSHAPDLLVPHSSQRLEVTVGASGQESLGDLVQFLVGPLPPGGIGAACHLGAGPLGQLAAGRRRLAEDLRDLVEGKLEDIVQYEGDAFGRAEPLQ